MRPVELARREELRNDALGRLARQSLLLHEQAHELRTPRHVALRRVQLPADFDHRQRTLARRGLEEREGA